MMKTKTFDSFFRMRKFDTKDVSVRAYKEIFHRTNQKTSVDAAGRGETKVDPAQSLDGVQRQGGGIQRTDSTSYAESRYQSTKDDGG